LNKFWIGLRIRVRVCEERRGNGGEEREKRMKEMKESGF